MLQYRNYVKFKEWFDKNFKKPEITVLTVPEKDEDIVWNVSVEFAYPSDHHALTVFKGYTKSFEKFVDGNYKAVYIDHTSKGVTYLYLFRDSDKGKKVIQSGVNAMFDEIEQEELDKAEHA